MGTWTNFEFDEFACPHCGVNETAISFIDKIQELRTRCGFPLKINSGYRCPDHNDAVSSTGRNGPHTTGRACDIGVSHEKAHRVLVEAAKMGKFTGIGAKQKGPVEGRFIHLDDLMDKDHKPRPTVWTY